MIYEGDSREDVERQIRDALPFHLEGMREAGLEIPAPTSSAGYVDVPVRA